MQSTTLATGFTRLLIQRGITTGSFFWQGPEAVLRNSNSPMQPRLRLSALVTSWKLLAITRRVRIARKVHHQKAIQRWVAAAPNSGRKPEWSTATRHMGAAAGNGN